MTKKIHFTITTLLTLCLFFFGETPNTNAQNIDTDDAYSFLLGLSIEELAQVPIQSSGLFPIKKEHVPGSLYVVSSEELDRYNIRSIAEYINKQVPGMSTAIHGTQGTTVGVRGLLIDNTSKTLLLRDNINMNNRHFVGINGSDLSSPLLGDIDSLEISLGPGAMRHGSGAINGSINLISATGKSKPGIRLKSQYGSGDTRMTEGSYGHVFSEMANLFFYGGYSKSDGVTPHYTLPASQWSNLNGVNGIPSETFLNNVRIGKSDDDYKFSFRTQLGKETDFFFLDLKALLSHTSNVDPALGYFLGNTASWADEIQRTADARGNSRYSPFYEQHSDSFLISPEIQLNFNKYNNVSIAPFYHTIKTTSVFSEFLLDEMQRLNITPTPIVLPSDCPDLNCQQEYSYGDELHLGVTAIHQYTGIKDQKIAWGGEIKYFDFETHPWHWTTTSVFGEDQLILGDFTFLAGLRYDKTYFGSIMASVRPFNDGPYKTPDDIDKVTSRLALSYQLSPNQTAKISYQEGFRFADAWLYEWAAHLRQENGTNSQISPEESESYEANYTLTGLCNNALTLQASFFYNVYHDAQGWIESLGTFGNSSATITSAGSELTLSYSPEKQFSGRVSYSYARPIDSAFDALNVANADDTWTKYPDHMVKLLLGYEITPNLFIGSNAVIESPRYDKAQTTDATVRDLFDKWSFVMDSNLWYRVNPHLKISLSAKEIIHYNYNQSPAYFNGSRPLDSPRAAEPQYYISATYTY